MLGGYANKIGFVNLSAGSVELKDSPEDWKLKYVGGRGMGVKYVFENGRVDLFPPENILCFMNGPLTGSEANMSGRRQLSASRLYCRNRHRQPSRRLECRKTSLGGFDGLIFNGKSEKPVYAYVTQDKVELLDASELWARGCMRRSSF